MFHRKLAVSLVSLILSSLLSGQDKGGAKGGKDEAPGKVDVQAELVALQKEIDTAGKDNQKLAALLTAFADRHRPDKGPVTVLTSADKKIYVAIGGNGTEKDHAAPTVEFVPTGTVLNVAVGGRGFDANTGDGGKGGTLVLKGKAKGRTILVGGAGGKGADVAGQQEGKTGGAGGTGGNVWYGAFGQGHESIGGTGGHAGNPGGTGGNGGSAGPGPVK